MVPLVIQDWTIGISMRNYVDRHFIRVTEEEGSLARNHFETIEKTFHRHLSKGNVELSLNRVRNAAHNLSISIKGMPGVEFFENMGTHLENVLKNTSSSVTLRIEDLHEAERHHLYRLFKRLSRYGDRIYVAVNEKLRDKVHIDSSVFNLVLEG
jgi:rubrerythrin